MLQVIEQSEEEKMAMYMKLSKKKLAIMLISCNDKLEIAIKNCNLPIVSDSAFKNGDYVIYRKYKRRIININGDKVKLYSPYGYRIMKKEVSIYDIEHYR